MKFEVSADEQGYEVCITEAYQGLTIDTERSGKLRICHRDGGVEVWEARADGALLWSSTSSAEAREEGRREEREKRAREWMAFVQELAPSWPDAERDQRIRALEAENANLWRLDTERAVELMKVRKELKTAREEGRREERGWRDAYMNLRDAVHRECLEFVHDDSRVMNMIGNLLSAAAIRARGDE